MKARYASELEEAKARIAIARSELRDKHKDARKQEDAMLQARAREREQDRRAVQMQIDVAKRGANNAQISRSRGPGLER